MRHSQAQRRPRSGVSGRPRSRRRSGGLAKVDVSQSGKPKPSPSRGTGRPRFALPSNLRGSLRHLDDAQLQTLLRAVIEEAGRRGRPINVGLSSSPQSESVKASKRPPPAAARTRAKTTPISPGQEKIIRAASSLAIQSAMKRCRDRTAQQCGQPACDPARDSSARPASRPSTEMSSSNSSQCSPLPE